MVQEAVAEYSAAAAGPTSLRFSKNPFGFCVGNVLYGASVEMRDQLGGSKIQVRRAQTKELAAEAGEKLLHSADI